MQDDKVKILIKTDRETALKLLKDKDINKKLKIFNRLNELPESDRVKVLLKILEDSSWSLREKASIELAKFGAKVVPRLIKLCRRGFWFTRAAACRTLGEIGDINGVEVILELLTKDDNPTVIKEGKISLIKIAAKNGDGFLLKLKEMVFEKKLNESALVVLKEYLPGMGSALDKIFQENRENDQRG
uniref:HEAT repeat domain-containing protein n=1 Tax=candidate division WOR-3 bacterium TaxID=2052148 RepID=A0A7C4XLE5_UNCW3